MPVKPGILEPAGSPLCFSVDNPGFPRLERSLMSSLERLKGPGDQLSSALPIL